MSARTIARRRVLKGLALGGATALMPRWARSAGDPGFAGGHSRARKRYDITVSRMPIGLEGRRKPALAFNGTVPGPLVHLRQGDDVTLHVINTLDRDTSIHWHGLLVPFEMDGVPGVNFTGIPAGGTFTYRFRLKQSGTYWYHSHTRFQEQVGLYGPLVIEPDGGEPFAYERDYTVVLSDFPDSDPEFIFDRLKKMSGEYYNYQRRTVADFVREVREDGLLSTLRGRTAWGEMRMSPVDLLAVTDAGYTYLMNGRTSAGNWTGLFRPGERVRLRVINASAMTHFDVRMPGLPLTMIQADGQYIEPVETEEFRIGVAETFDFLVEPPDDRAYTLFAESLDRSGSVRGTLAPRPGMAAAVPALRPRPVRKLDEIGMGMMDESLAFSSGRENLMPNMPERPDVNVAMRVMEPRSRLHEPGIGLGDDGWRVLTYSQLRALDPRYPREPQREVFLNLTANMNRFMFSPHPGPA
jgi:CopA family copper-resistance protein